MSHYTFCYKYPEIGGLAQQNGPDGQILEPNGDLADSRDFHVVLHEYA